MKRNLLTSVSLALLFTSHAVLCDEIGLGRDRDTPDTEPAEPASTETGSLWQELLEWFDAEIEQ